MSVAVNAYSPLCLKDIANLILDADTSDTWRLIAEFLEGFKWESPNTRFSLLQAEPATTGDKHWDVFLAGLAEYLAFQDNRPAPGWAQKRQLQQFWFPFNSPAARVDAFVHSPASFRRRGVFISPQELAVA